MTFTSATARAAGQRGGATRAAQPSAQAARVAGGRTRAAQPTFRAHQVARGKRGYATTTARYGAGFALEKVCAYRRQHPSDLERWVADTLSWLGLREGDDWMREVAIDLPDPPRVALVDFVVNGAAAVVCVLPGARRFHGGPAETIDGRDRAARDRAIDAQLEAHGYTVLRLDDACILRRPDLATRQIAAAVQGPAGQVAA